MVWNRSLILALGLGVCSYNLSGCLDIPKWKDPLRTDDTKDSGSFPFDKDSSLEDCVEIGLGHYICPIDAGRDTGGEFEDAGGDVPVTDTRGERNLDVAEPEQDADSTVCYRNSFDRDFDLDSIIFQNGGEWRRNPEGYLEQVESHLDGWKIGYLEGIELRDLEANVRVRLLADQNPASGVAHSRTGLLFRYDNLIQRGYILQIRNVNRDTFEFALEDFNRRDIQTVQVNCGEIGCGYGSWHELKVRVTGNQIICYLDEQEMFTVNDNTYQRGKIAFAAYSFNASNFDDLDVCGE